GEERAARRIADLERRGERRPARLLGLAGRLAAPRRGDLAAEGRRLEPRREDRRRALLLGPRAEDAVAREDVEGSAGRVVAHADLVDELSGAAERGLEVACAARSAVEDRSELGEAVHLGEGELAAGERREVVVVPLGRLDEDAVQRDPEPGQVGDRRGDVELRAYGGGDERQRHDRPPESDRHRSHWASLPSA